MLEVGIALGSLFCFLAVFFVLAMCYISAMTKRCIDRVDSLEKYANALSTQQSSIDCKVVSLEGRFYVDSKVDTAGDKE